MAARDILGELEHRTMSSDEVEALFSSVMDSPEAADAVRLLSLSNLEWTAYCQGASFEQLSRWRFVGWPTHCGVCEKPIAAESYSWLVAEVEGQFSLRHIQCPD